MSERLTIRLPAPDGSKWSDEAAAGMVGQTVPQRYGPAPAFGELTFIACCVVEDGAALVAVVESDSFPSSLLRDGPTIEGVSMGTEGVRRVELRGREIS